MRRGDGGGGSHGGVARYAPGTPDQAAYYSQLASKRATVARFFVDLRRALRLTPPQAALTLATRVEIIEALEHGHVELLPDWQTASRLIANYTARAGIDHRPVLTVVGDLMSDIARFRPAQLPPPAAAVADHDAAPGRTPPLRRAGSAFAAGAKLLPHDAIRRIRARPDRVFYALSLPLGVLILALNSSLLSHVAKPFEIGVHWVSSSMHEFFPPVRDGLRWIDVDDPRSRRGDKLPTPGR